jgi:ribonuclease BN (tRNA processing enzyme)
MTMFDVIAIGVGDTFSDRHHTSALVLRAGDFHLAVDCPDRYREALVGRGVELGQIDDVLITHVHGDHMNGLEGVAFFKHFVERKRTRLWITPDVRSVIWEQRLVASMGQLWDGAQFRSMAFADYFDHRELSWTAETVIGPFRVRTRRTRHHVPTCALLVEAGGRTLGYSSDTAFDPSLIERLSTADLIIHETNLGPAHTAYADLARLPSELRAKMRLIHYPDSFDRESSSIACLREGDVLRV